MSEHRGPVNALKINRDGSQCVSASADGSCIVWCLVSRYAILHNYHYHCLSCFYLLLCPTLLLTLSLPPSPSSPSTMLPSLIVSLHYLLHAPLLSRFDMCASLLYLNQINSARYSSIQVDDISIVPSYHLLTHSSILTFYFSPFISFYFLFFPSLSFAFLICHSSFFTHKSFYLSFYCLP